MERCAAGPEMMCLAWITLLAYLRMATHPRIFGRPLSPRAAEANVEAPIELPHMRTLAEEQGFWIDYREVTSNMHVRGNLVPDSPLAALMRQHGVRVLYTGDRGFNRFGYLEVRDPFRS